MNLTLIIIISVGILVLLILAGHAIVNFSGEEMLNKFNQTSNVVTNMSAVELANSISQNYFHNRIRLTFKPNKFCDCYASNNVLTLCSEYANKKNLAGLAICAHELGHAFQFKNQAKKMQKYGKKINTSKFLSKLVNVILFVAIILVFFEKLILSGIVAGIAILVFISALSVKLSTIKIEEEASSTAIEILRTQAYLTESELQIAKEFLNSAKQTYVADLLKSMLKWTGLTRK